MRASELAKTLEHTVLAPTATRQEVDQACADALELNLAAVRTHPVLAPTVSRVLAARDVQSATVIGFPFGTDLPRARAAAAAHAVDTGAADIGVVLNIPALLSGDYSYARRDLVRVVRTARARASLAGRGEILVTAIIEAPLLDHKLRRIACRIAAEAKVDFAATSTGVLTRARAEDVALMREELPGEVGVSAWGGAATIDEVMDLVDAGAVRVATSAAAQIVRGALLSGMRR